MTTFLKEKQLESPRLHAEILLEHVLKCDRMALYTSFDRPADPHELAELRALVARAAKHEPVAYLTGSAYFFGLRLAVNQHTLIPRPSTETIVEYILQQQQVTPSFDSVDSDDAVDSDDPAEPPVDASSETPVASLPEATPAPLNILEIGTGSGCIAIALAKHLPQARIVATDISSAALAVAEQNALEHSVEDRIEFLEGSLYEPIPADSSFDYVISNPPYISDAEWEEVARNVADHEPVKALRAGPDGLAVLDPLISAVHEYLKPSGGQALFEMSASQSAPIRRCVEANPELDHEIEILADLEGHPRIVVCRRLFRAERGAGVP